MLVSTLLNLAELWLQLANRAKPGLLGQQLMQCGPQPWLYRSMVVLAPGVVALADLFWLELLPFCCST